MYLPPGEPTVHNTPHRRSTPDGAWLDLSAILFLGALLLTPVLISPHFGLFSDYSQILGWPARHIHSYNSFVREFRPLGDGRWTPMFHLITFGLYVLIGPSAFRFYVVQGLTLEASLAIVYLLTRWLAQGRRGAGWTACLLILVSAPFAENYFTLDKVEPRLVFFSLLSLGYFAWRIAKARQRPVVSVLETAMVFTMQFLAATLLIFSKETGAFIVAVAFLALAGARLQRDRDPRVVIEAALFFGATVVSLVLYIWLSSALMSPHVRAVRAQSGGVGRYLDYALTFGLVVQNTQGYFTWMKDTALCVLIFGAWSVAGLWKFRRRNWDDRRLLLFLAGSAGIFYATGILLWRWMLLYYMLPTVVFLAVAAGAIAFDRHTTNLSRIGWPVAIMLLALPTAVEVPARWRTAWAILAQDRSKDVILNAMQKHAETDSKFVVAMFDVGSAEIGSSLERYLQRNAYTPPYPVYNLVEGPWVNFADKHRFDGSAAEPPRTEEMDQARDLDSPFVIWRYKPWRLIHRVWWMEALAPGDLVVIPVGSPSNVAVQARGIAAFSNSREAILRARFPGVRMKVLEEAHVQDPLAQDYLGWDLLEVTKLEAGKVNLAGLDRELAGRNPAKLDSSQVYLGNGWSSVDWTHTNGTQAVPFRWGYNGAQLQAPRRGAKMTLDLEPNGQLARLPIKIRALDPTGREIASWALSGRMKVEFTAPAGEMLILRLQEEIQVTANTICFRLFGVSADSN
jgi:hypothetical protein